ncbi:MAG: penicillin acylase family protein [Rhodanobacteraceae bacterium]|nr:penicillin acylase family protein [Rhodanobacteraceae bacterium]
MTKSNPLPVEYAALELTRAEPWSPVDTFVVGKLLTFQLGFDDDTGLTVRLGAYQQAGVAAGFDGTKLFFDDLTRVKPADGRITLPNSSPASVAAKPTAEKSGSAGDIPMIDPATLSAAQQHVDAIKDNPWLAPMLETNAKRGGSNWWLIGGGKTVDGKAILANDPHLAMDMPALWNEAHIVSTDPQFPQPMDVVGVSVPGTPNVLLGCTTHHCWGQTVNPMDMSDAFSEKFRLNTYGLPTHTIHSGVAEPVIWIFQSYFANNPGRPDHRQCRQGQFDRLHQRRRDHHRAAPQQRPGGLDHRRHRHQLRLHRLGCDAGAGNLSAHRAGAESGRIPRSIDLLRRRQPELRLCGHRRQCGLHRAPANCRCAPICRRWSRGWWRSALRGS